VISESLRAIIVIMSNDTWREEVALLLERCATSLRERKDRQGAADLGAAMAYLQRAEDEGERGAITLLAQVCVVRSLDQTERFSFAPGELELLEQRSNGK
jgi:hypothetical protein